MTKDHFYGALRQSSWLCSILERSDTENFKKMETYRIQIVLTGVVLIGYFITKYVTNKIIGGVGRKFTYPKVRIKMVCKMINGILFIILTTLVLFIWGVDKDDLMYFTTSLLAVVGIAFFAQWSIISNVTSTVIIYFSHPVRLGDTITVLDKDYNIEGKISDIGIFFLTIKTNDNEEITMPSNVFMQKLVRKKLSDS